MYPGMSVIALAAAGLVATSCTDECERASDCLRGEVCYIGACTPASSSQLACQSDLDCNEGSSTNLRCVGGRCVINPSSVTPSCTIRPVCFERENATPITPFTLTATVGSVLADQGVALVEAVALNSPGSSLFRVVGRTSDSSRFFCATVDSSNNSCSLIQISLGDPASPGSTIFQSSMCSATLEQAMGGRLIGTVSGNVADCNNAPFDAGAAFDIPYQAP